MLPGPDYVIACPFCGHQAMKHSVMSGNTFGATLWSDGFMFAPMYPDLPVVVRCRNCKGFYILDEAPEIEEISAGEISEEIDPELYVSHLHVAEYPQALDSPLAKIPDVARYLRMRFWWAMNHHWRYHAKSEKPPKSDQTVYNENLEHLLKLLPEKEVLMKAEIQRNLGRFNECIELLEKIDEEYENFTKQIRSRALKGSKRVFRLAQEKF